RPELVTVAVADWPPLMELEGRQALLGPEIDIRVALDGYEAGWAEADALSMAAAVARLESADADAVFVYLGNPDETSHATGSIGEEYRSAIAEADAHVGRLVQAVRDRPGYASEDWLILVSTDHGRRPDGGHGGDSPEEMTTFIVVSGAAADTAIAPPTYIVDVAATALAHMGVDVEGLDGRPVGLRHR
ncbi:MAG: alkaline phosphatase family protein, partial [Longimicrobiales bacterium]|nr:alkaline phosphatase family protein [Longimicrobiales bacterium]